MRGVAFLGNRKLGYIDIEDPTPGPGEVVVEVKASGMCGSDLHFYRAITSPDIADDKRLIGGHEPCGIVAAVGSGVPAHVAKPGDRVMVHHYHGCTYCTQCRSGWPQLCHPTTRTVYSFNAHGSHAPYMKVPASTLVRLDDGLSYEAGAAIACGTGTAWGALQRIKLKGDETIAVFGQGPVGLSVTLLARALGARVIALDLDDHRLALAKSFGADLTINPSQVDPKTAILEATKGLGVSAAIETSGSSAGASAALNSLSIWGTLCLVGLGSTLGVELKSFLDRQINVMTSYSMSIIGQQQCADFVLQKNLDLSRLFSDRWRLDQAEEAYIKFDKQTSGKGVFLL